MKLFPFSHFTVSGSSMTPTLMPGQDLLVFKWWELLELKVGDLVVVNVRGKDMVKRVQKVFKQSVFVIGDNPKASTDSRKFGPVKKSQIVGKVIWVS